MIFCALHNDTLIKPLDVSAADESKDLEDIPLTLWLFY